MGGRAVKTLVSPTYRGGRKPVAWEFRPRQLPCGGVVRPGWDMAGWVFDLACKLHHLPHGGRG